MTNPTGTTEIIGILGGMGPATTADFYTKLVSMTPGHSDQDHLRTVIWSDPTIPDRTEALLGVIAIRCNTAHAFVPRIADHVGLPIVHMIGEAASHLTTLQPAVRTTGLLATTGTIRAGLYQEWLDRYGIRLVLPDPARQQDQVMAAIRAVKAGNQGAAAAPWSMSRSS